MYLINPEDKQGKGTRWVLLFIYKITAAYFISFGIEYIP